MVYRQLNDTLVEASYLEIDEARQAKKVAEITDSDYFKQLRGQAEDLRRIMGGADEAA